MMAAHYKGAHHPGNDLGLHYTALPPIVASCPYSDQLLVTRKFWSPGANRPSRVSRAAIRACRRLRPEVGREGVRNEWAGAMVSASRAHARVGREIGPPSLQRGVWCERASQLHGSSNDPDLRDRYRGFETPLLQRVRF